jgi:hypothetical protein
VHRSQRRLALGSGSLQHDAAHGGAEPIMQVTAKPAALLW